MNGGTMLNLFPSVTISLRPNLTTAGQGKRRETYEVDNMFTLRPKQNVGHFVGDILKCILFYEIYNDKIQISMTFIPKGLTNI